MDDNISDLVYTAFSCYEVQRTISSYLSLKDVKSLRLVNRMWRHVASHALKEKSLVTLDSPLIFQTYLEFLEEQESQDEEEFICFSNYKVIIKPDKFTSLQQATLIFSQFWSKCGGGFVKELSLKFPSTCCHPILTQIYCSSNSSNQVIGGDDVGIERLSLSLDDNNVVVEESDGDQSKWSAAEEVDETGDNFLMRNNNALISLQLNVSIVLSIEKKVFPFSWTQWVQSCSNICHLSIQSDYGSVQFFRLINALVDKRVVLKTLKIGTRDQRLFSDDFLKKLVLLTGNGTDSVSLGFLPSVKHDTALDWILHHGSPTLKQLSFLQLRTSNQGTIMSFTASDTKFSPCFPHLECLRITKELVPNLAFLVKMPKLRRLEIYRDSTVGQHDTLSNPVIRTTSLSVVMEHMSSLVLEPFVPVEHVWKLTNWFPNLHRLQIRANDLIARVIFARWLELREMYLIAEVSRDNNDIVRSALTDEGITGLTREDLSTETTQALIRERRNMAHIGNLTKLETCKLQVVPDYQTGLTDYSIHYGLAEVGSLKAVTLVKTLVSPAAADALRQQGVHVNLLRE